MPEGDPIVFSPPTFARHDKAATYINSLSRTRDPMGRRDRNPRIIPGAWGRLAAGQSITAASGLTLGTGSVKLCDREGTVADDAEPVDVANAGGVITAVGDTILALEWVEGEWTVCGCKPSEVPALGCSPCPIPLTDLTVSWSGGSFGSGSIPLVHSTFVDGISGDTVDQWQATQSFTFEFGVGDHDVVFYLSCQFGNLQLSVSVPDDAVVDGTCQSDISITTLTHYIPEVPADRTCGPFHMRFRTTDDAETDPTCQFLWCPGCLGGGWSRIKDIFIDGP